MGEAYSISALSHKLYFDVLMNRLHLKRNINVKRLISETIQTWHIRNPKYSSITNICICKVTILPHYHITILPRVALKFQNLKTSRYQETSAYIESQIVLFSSEILVSKS